MGEDLPSYVGDGGANGGCGGAWEPHPWWTLTWPAEYISSLCSPSEVQVCVPLLPAPSRGLDELHLGKWMLLISTPCYTDHLRTRRGSDESA